MMAEKPSLTLRTWRGWLLETIEREIYSAHGISLSKISGEYFELLQLKPPDFKIQAEAKKYQSFLRQFSLLCKRRLGFDPSDEKDREHYDYDQELVVPNWTPNFGVAGASFAKNCYIFHAEQVKAAERQLEEIQRTIEFLGKKNKRTRLPSSVARCILYFLMTFKGHSEEIVELRRYFSKGAFHKDLERMLFKFSNRALILAKKENLGNPIHLDLDAPTIKAISRLANHRGSRDSRMWASHLRQDLIRILLSEGLPKIRKLAEATERERILSGIMRDGNRAVIRRASPHKLF